ncbi:Inosine/uridine-preferring nucleoside hydrolase domain-containing protein [Neohortaea acidophila]|uniref:Inosine/uridine-preferring nucleoside hydrolase domain-containing protein n=1 Tax=Neohortaea acidophila TaxID=245834 RepID=A0A6A6PXZ1_9PEZI|nr:Inosine/uridine-preferring nucleoside hydrolase domain-containing protein [Neohortaea acidophila]KAF2484373.1 Inosine/uridine-preferring nucleoside hydrolase domain-containing protein [Neohortaea acidophila]
MAPRKIIIDTDPGVDDILAMLLAFSGLPSEVEVLLVSVTYGNVDVRNCLRNVVSLFSIIEKEMAWRRAQGRPVGFDTLRQSKPLVAVGPEHPLADEMLMADFFHGRDGLGEIHTSHPHLSPADTWKALFDDAESSADPEQTAIAEELKKTDSIFTASRTPAHLEILRLLRENEPDTITIVAVGPLTNLALAAAADPETFLRTKEVVVMGGNVHHPGNMTPVAEFNTYADTIAAARVYALTSPNPHTTMPPVPPAPPGTPEGTYPPPFLNPYPPNLPERLKLSLFPLDITEQHLLTRGAFRALLSPLTTAHSPLAEWTQAFMTATFAKVESLHPVVTGDAVSLQLHDPMCTWYCMTAEHAGWKFAVDEDLRVETAGQWTRGMCVVDRRDRPKSDDADLHEVAGDTDGWVGGGKGNRLRICIDSPGRADFGAYMVKRIFGL